MHAVGGRLGRLATVCIVRTHEISMHACFLFASGNRFLPFFLQNTDQRTTDFKYLTSKDQELSREIEVKIRKIERLQSSLQHWRTKVLTAQRLSLTHHTTVPLNMRGTHVSMRTTVVFSALNQ